MTSSHTTIPHEGQTGYRLPITMALGVLKGPMSRVGVGSDPGEWGECNMKDGSRVPIEEEKALIELKQRIIGTPDGKAKEEMKSTLERGKSVLSAMLLPKILDGTATGPETGSYFCWKGDEFGATTGRPRRLGPLDLVLARHVADTVGLDGVIFTKWDVYSGTGDVPFIDRYVFDNDEYVDAASRHGFLNEWQFANLDRAQAITRALPGWKDTIAEITDRADLPNEVLTAIDFAQKAIGKPCIYFSTGPKKDDLVVLE